MSLIDKIIAAKLKKIQGERTHACGICGMCN